MFVFDLLSDGRCVFTCITLSEDEEGHVSSNSYLFEASIDVVIEFIQGVVEISGNIIHAFDIGTGMVRVGVAETSSNGLINKDDVVLLYPGEIVLYD